MHKTFNFLVPSWISTDIQSSQDIWEQSPWLKQTGRKNKKKINLRYKSELKRLILLEVKYSTHPQHKNAMKRNHAEKQKDLGLACMRAWV